MNITQIVSYIELVEVKPKPFLLKFLILLMSYMRYETDVQIADCETVKRFKYIIIYKEL